MSLQYFDRDAVRTALEIAPAQAHFLIDRTGCVIGATVGEQGASLFDRYNVDDEEKRALLAFMSYGTSSAFLLQSREAPLLVFRCLAGVLGAFLVAVPPKALCVPLSGSDWLSVIKAGGVALSPATLARGACLSGSYAEVAAWLSRYRALLRREWEIVAHDALLGSATVALGMEIAGAMGCSISYEPLLSCPIRASHADLVFLRGVFVVLCLFAQRASSEAKIEISLGMEDAVPVLYARASGIPTGDGSLLERLLLSARERGIPARIFTEPDAICLACALVRSEISDQQLRAGFLKGGRL